jgi:hypothetical protein
MDKSRKQIIIDLTIDSDRESEYGCKSHEDSDNDDSIYDDDDDDLISIVQGESESRSASDEDEVTSLLDSELETDDKFNCGSLEDPHTLEEEEDEDESKMVLTKCSIDCQMQGTSLNYLRQKRWQKC